MLLALEEKARAAAREGYKLQLILYGLRVLKQVKPDALVEESSDGG